jgi:putative phosphoribosyl transferase
MKPLFQNRNEAGRLLAQSLTSYAGDKNVLVLALPRGGVPVAYEVAKILALPLDLLLVRKLGSPGQEELAMGAIASGGQTVLNEAIVAALSLSAEDIARVQEREQQELERRMQKYRGPRPHPDLRAKNVILVDDGLATGATMLAAVLAVNQQSPNKVIVAVPVSATDAIERIRALADDVLYLAKPEPFVAVGCWYEAFSQVTDQEVIDCLEKAWGKL